MQLMASTGVDVGNVLLASFVKKNDSHHCKLFFVFELRVNRKTAGQQLLADRGFA